MTFAPNRPYNDLSSLPPKVDVESRTVLKQAIAASRALAEENLCLNVKMLTYHE